jgi:hypothetical protein
VVQLFLVVLAVVALVVNIQVVQYQVLLELLTQDQVLAVELGQVSMLLQVGLDLSLSDTNIKTRNKL